MGRLRRFAEHRFVGIRDTMRVYDCDDEVQYAELEEHAATREGKNLFQTFGPDTLEEARNRGFRPVHRRGFRGSDSGSRSPRVSSLDNDQVHGSDAYVGWDESSGR